MTTEDYDDAAQAVGASATGDNGGGGELGAMSDSASIAFGIVPLGLTATANGQINGNRLGLAYSFSITCEDVNGNTLAVCSPLTDRAEVDAAWNGTLDTRYLDAEVDRSGSWTLDGLQSNTITFDGQSSFSYDATLQSIFRPGVTTSLSFDADADYDAVAIDGPTHDAIGGSATFDVSGRKVVTGTDADVDKSFAVHAELEFHADRTATMTLDGDHSYTLNLATGAVVRL
jgi:hypothetical protein